MAEFNNINIINRKEIEIKGVKDVISYESNKICLELDDAELTLSGSDFNIKKIDVDNKVAEISGFLTGLTFADALSKRSTKSFLASLFK